VSIILRDDIRMGEGMKKRTDWDDWLPHPGAPASREFDWRRVGLPHPDSPAGRYFGWWSIGLPHPQSPAGWKRHHPKQKGKDEKPADTFVITKMDSNIEGLKLSEVARKAAYELKAKCPTVEFTSGRRDKEEQARAMAANVVMNRKWIQETYTDSKARDAAQKWVDNHPEAKSVDEIAAGLKQVLDGLSNGELGTLSKHLSGDAFDVQPVTKQATKIKRTIRSLPGLTKFLEEEGGLERWHVQF
jgi:hypothetical protein